EDLLQIGVERRMAAIRRGDIGELLGPDTAQYILQRRDVPGRQVEGDVLFGEVAATPDHLVVARHRMDRAHRCLRSAFPKRTRCVTHRRRFIRWKTAPTLRPSGPLDTKPR